MRDQDKVRWGSRWVTTAEHTTLLAEQKEADRRIADRTTVIKRLDADISQMETRLDTLARMKNQLAQSGSAGRLATFHREVRDLQKEIQDRKSERAQLAREARDIAAKRPEPQWSHNLVLLPITSPVEGIVGAPTEDAAVREALMSRKAVLVAHDGVFLGRLTVARHDTESLWNPLGEYGSPYSPTSIFNPSSPFGPSNHDTSPWNPSATHPPTIRVDDAEIAYLTANESLKPAITVERLILTLKLLP